jgi:hypothetical protein
MMLVRKFETLLLSERLKLSVHSSLSWSVGRKSSNLPARACPDGGGAGRITDGPAGMVDGGGSRGEMVRGKPPPGGTPMIKPGA